MISVFEVSFMPLETFETVLMQTKFVNRTLYVKEKFIYVYLLYYKRIEAVIYVNEYKLMKRWQWLEECKGGFCLAVGLDSIMCFWELKFRTYQRQGC